MPRAKFETNFEPQGTLQSPGWLGRLVRILLGIWCLHAIYQYIDAANWILEKGYPFDNWSAIVGLILAFLLLPYVVNIGWTLNFKRLPQLIVLIISAFTLLAQITVENHTFNWFTLLWLIYVYAHLGLSFLLSGIIATPGCEMRAIPDLYSKVTGKAVNEHYCPGPLHLLDQWENRRKVRKSND